ncbi:MAG: methyltransferase domain-containing protein [Longimicrobiaceae bacterium]
MVAILSNQRDVIFAAVQAMYTEVASHPARGFHFPTGRAACEFVGYPTEQLDAIPAAAVESFAGVGYPFAADAIEPSDTVLDIGSGSGTDALIASHLAGPRGRVIGLDMTPAMLDKLERNAALAGATTVEWLQGNAEEIPLPASSVDVVTSNGVINLVPDKPAALAEILRVLRPGGRVQIADIVTGKPISDACRSNPELWAECVVGATTKDEYLELFRAAGFAEVEVLGHLDYFSASSSPETRSIAASFNAHSLVMRAVKPPAGK